MNEIKKMQKLRFNYPLIGTYKLEYLEDLQRFQAQYWQAVIVAGSHIMADCQILKGHRERLVSGLLWKMGMDFDSAYAAIADANRIFADYALYSQISDLPFLPSYPKQQEFPIHFPAGDVRINKRSFSFPVEDHRRLFKHFFEEQDIQDLKQDKPDFYLVLQEGQICKLYIGYPETIKLDAYRSPVAKDIIRSVVQELNEAKSRRKK